MNFDSIWNNIIHCAGQEFRTKKGLPFTYQVINGAVVPDRTDYPLAKNNFEKAAMIKELTGPGEIKMLARGPTYVYAILTDKRIW